MFILMFAFVLKFTRLKKFQVYFFTSLALQIEIFFENNHVVFIYILSNFQPSWFSYCQDRPFNENIRITPTVTYKNLRIICLGQY